MISLRIRHCFWFNLPLLVLVLAGCASPANRSAGGGRIAGESVVLVGEEPARLAFPPSRLPELNVRSHYLRSSNSVVYQAGRDYAFDAASATLRRLPGSRIPDFGTNVLHGKEDFDHSKFPGFGNTGFFAFVDYCHSSREPWPRQVSQVHLLPKTSGRLKSGADLKIVAYGDSITAGGDATGPELIFWKRWADALQKKHPNSRITAVNGATGGDSTVQGLRRLQVKVLDEKPDLVLIGFGMNDHNRGGVPIPQFEANLKEMIAKIRSQTGAEVVLFSAFPPNPKWRFGSHRMEEYAAATGRVAVETGAAFADVYRNWLVFADRKKPSDLLGNNINHPNDFGHWIYFSVLFAVFGGIER